VPLFGALVAWVWLKDRPHATNLVGLAIGFAGVALLAGGNASFKPAAGSDWFAAWAPNLAIAACLLATLCYALAASFTKRYLSGLPPLVTATGSQIGATLGLALPALWLRPTAMPGPLAWLALLASGILCTGVAYILYFRLIERAGPARALAVTFLIPVFALLYGAVFLGERITAWMVLCGVVILCGTALSTGLFKLRR
jgi:drug/metabolite transporter (DMT)-like permease